MQSVLKDFKNQVGKPEAQRFDLGKTFGAPWTPTPERYYTVI